MKVIRQAAAIAVMGLVSAVATGCASTSHHARTEPLFQCYQVDPSLYRGAQPTPEGFRRLADLGVKTIVNLRAQGRVRRVQERQLAESLGMQWVSLPMRSYWRPTDAQVRAFLELVSDPSRQPVFVHCEQGEDRTGSLVAVYRVARQGWAPEQAYTEALALGLAAWNPFMRSLIFRDARHLAAVRTASVSR